MGAARHLVPALLLLLASTAAAAQDAAADNAEMTAIFSADQAARQPGEIDWVTVNAADAERRLRTRALIEQGELRTARDLYHAAFIFQHGNEADDHLLGHVLAVRALAMGLAEAEGIARSTLDRYLQKIDRGQVYGTQVRFAPETGTTLEPFDKTLVPDALRQAMGAPSIAELEANLPEMDAMMQSLLPAPPEP